MTREDELILLLARGNVPCQVQERALALLATPINWKLIIERATEQEIYPLLHRNLAALGFPAVPAEARKALESLYKINAFRNVHLVEEVERTLRLFSGAAIPAIPLKGVALAKSLYGHPSTRVCNDIDILVPRHTVRDAFRLLLADGFEAHDQKVELSDIDLLLDSNIEYSFVTRREGLAVLYELHWDIAWRWQRNGALTNDLWAEAKPKTYWGVEGYALCPEWALLYLAVHASRHQWQGLKWLIDIDEMCVNSQVDWEKLGAKAEGLQLKQMLIVTLSACHALLGTQLPADLYTEVLPRWVKLFPAHPAPVNIWQANIFPAHLIRQPWEKLAYLGRVFLVPTLAERRLLRLPAFLSFLYYLLRPLRLSAKWCWYILQGIKRLVWLEQVTSPPKTTTAQN